MGRVSTSVRFEVTDWCWALLVEVGCGRALYPFWLAGLGEGAAIPVWASNELTTIVLS